MPEGVTGANAVTTAFFGGQASMMMLSTGSLSFVRDNMKSPYRVAFLPRNLRNAVPIGGGSLVLPEGQLAESSASAGWTLIKWLTRPEIVRRLEPLHRLFRAAHRRLRPAGDEGLHRRASGRRKVALDQLAYASPGSPPTTPSPCARRWRTGCRRCCPARQTPKAAIVQGAEGGRRAHAALCGEHGAETAAVSATR